MMRVLLTRRWPDSTMAMLRQRYDETVDELDRPMTQAALAQAMQCFDAICPTVSHRIGAEVLNVPARRVRILANYGARIEHVDLDAARAYGVVVTNTPDVLTEATAELTILLMLMASRRASEGERKLRFGDWTGWRPTHLVGSSLPGKLLGLVGFGRIAQAVARRARRVRDADRLPWSPAGAAGDCARAAGQPGARLPRLPSEADVLSLHCPGGAATRHLVNEGLPRG